MYSSIKLITRIAESDQERKALFQLRHSIYSKWGFISDIKKKSDIDEYDLNDKSVHYITLHSNQIIGTIRLIFAKETELPIERAYHIHDLVILNTTPRKNIVEVSRLVSANKGVTRFSDNRIMMSLIKAIHDYSYLHDTCHWFAAIDERLYGIFVKQLKFPWVQVSKKKRYLGSVSVPVYLYLPKAMEFLHDNNNIAWKAIVHGMKNSIVQI